MNLKLDYYLIEMSKKVSQTGQRFMETFMLYPKSCYESFPRQTLEAIEEKNAVIRREGLA